MKAWEHEKTTPEYLKRRQMSEKLTAARLELKKAAHAARRALRDARKIVFDIRSRAKTHNDLERWEQTLLRDLKSGKLEKDCRECDEAYGWNLQMRIETSTAAGRLGNFRT